MDRKNVWILAGAILAGFLIFGLTQLSAQRFPGDGRGGEGMVGRYQVVRSSPEAILLLDTVTGELYSAGREDIRPSSARNRGDRGLDEEMRKGMKMKEPERGFGKSSDKGEFKRGHKVDEKEFDLEKKRVDFEGFKDKKE